MNRLRRKTVTIDRPFRLRNGTRNHPAGDYEITTEEEPFGDLMFEAFRRIRQQFICQKRQGRLASGKFSKSILKNLKAFSGRKRSTDR